MAGALRHSSTYQKIFREGWNAGWVLGYAESRAQVLAIRRHVRDEVSDSEWWARAYVEGARLALISAGARRFGPPDQAARAAICRQDDLEQLAELAERVLDASSWDELGLDKPTP
jgi:hypothetical protein